MFVLIVNAGFVLILNAAQHLGVREVAPRTGWSESGATTAVPTAESVDRCETGPQGPGCPKAT
jgi:hypothetical protein